MGGKTAGAGRAPRAGVDHPARGLEALDREEHLRPPGIDEPQLPYSRGVVGSRQALRVFPHGCIADDLDDQVGTPFEFHEPVGPASRCRHQAHAAGRERGFRHRHDVGFDRKVRYESENLKGWLEWRDRAERPGATGVVEPTPFEFLDRLADLVPPPRKHRHRYHGVFAPNQPLRQAVTALAVGSIDKQRPAANNAHAGHDALDRCGTHAKPRTHHASIRAAISCHGTASTPGAMVDSRVVCAGGSCTTINRGAAARGPPRRRWPSAAANRWIGAASPGRTVRVALHSTIVSRPRPGTRKSTSSPCWSRK